MSNVAKIVLIIIAIVAIAFAIAFGVSRYLVGKLDGTGLPPSEQPATVMLQYASEDGYSFEYPNTYELSSRTDGDHDVLVLLPKGYIPPEGGEGPPAIAVSVFYVVDNESVASWLQGDPRSNYQLSVGEAATTIVGGNPGLAYTHSGLYENDAVVVKYDNKIIMFSAGWLTPGDQTRQDFMRILSTVQFN